MLRQFLHQIKLNAEKGATYSQLKYFFRWKKSLRPGASSVKDEQPWITYDAISFLSDVVNQKAKVFEYGGGGSTLFFTKRAAEVVTVEHNEEWFNLLKELLASRNINNWKGQFQPGEKGAIQDPSDSSDPSHYSSEDIPSKGLNYKKYASFIDNYPDAYFDVIIVDGRSRPACLQHGIPKLHSGGYLVLDNSDRAYYLAQMQKQLNDTFRLVLDNTGASPYSPDFTKTSIWKKQ
jgi:hypothetical protein